MHTARSNEQIKTAPRHPWRWFVGLYLAGVVGVAVIAGGLHALTALIS